MRRTTTALAALLLLTGCSAGEPDAEPDPAQPTESTSDAPAVDTRPPLVFDNGSSASVEGDCGDRAPVWFEVALPMTVRREVRLGEVTVAGDGRLARPVLVAPRRGGGGAGVVSAGPDPGWSVARRQPGWRQRERLDGAQPRPGTWTVFLRVRITPDSAVEGFDIAWDDGRTTGTERLAHGLGVTRDCG
ncbi:hypothetical protein GCM10009623_29450 [Nocardioides aestuarii]|uniref:DUF2771 family protein n=1 Tax=Nocardioides aestuarii TaxID=252231 RepID=A0ABW4TN81_9ACTN